MSGKDFNEVKIVDQKRKNVITQPNQRKTKMFEQDGEVVLCCASYCQML